ncbi:Gamma-crystallin N [Orchesella cincta]|uniref:Gamma-crystallin N n=1 Tax=Orchesella cincta TaxID=48709 RepID=A0A1D2MA75_ORCCI|nr:Gamma-crystallin N [Orchesella cincta]
MKYLLPSKFLLFVIISGAVHLSNCQESLETALYERYGSTGAHINLFGNCPDLSALGFDNRSNSSCVSGFWLFYAEPNYCYGGVRFGYSPYGTTKYCFDFTANAASISSARSVASVEGLSQDSLTLYEDVCFIGEELRITNSLSALTSLVGQHESLIITGTSSWTLCEGENYTRPKICLQAIANTPLIISNLRNLGIHPGSIRSIRKGCTAKESLPTEKIEVLASSSACSPSGIK